MASIFLSYSHDNRRSALALAHALEGAGHEVWWDRRLGGGEEFSEEIEAALEKADLVVVAWSKESIKSRWVRDEAAVGCERAALVPVSIDGSLPPMGFRQFHTIDLRGWKGSSGDRRTREFLDAVEKRLSGKDGAAPGPLKTIRKTSPSLIDGSKKLWWAVGSLVAVAAVAVSIFLFAARETPSGRAPKPTIALLPFKSVPGDAELQQLATQTREAIAHTFSQSGVPIRVTDSEPQKDDPGADFLISGDVSRTGEKIRVSVRLDEAVNRVTVFSDRFEASGDELTDLPERVGAQTAGNLTWSAPMLVLDRSHPIEPALMADLLRGSDFNSGLDSLQSYQNDKGLALRQPNLAMAQVNMAFATGFVLAQLPRGERAEAVAQARRAGQRAAELRPDFGDTHAIWCVLHSDAEMVECENQLRSGKRVDPDAPFLNTFLSHLLRNAGRSEEAGELARLAYAHDIYVPTKMAWMLETLEFSGEEQAARELYEQGVRWWPDYQGMFFRNRLYGLIQRGDFESLLPLEKASRAAAVQSGYQGSSAIVAAVRSKSSAALRRACPQEGGYLLMVRCMLAFAKIGDLNGAFAVADKLYPRRLGRTRAETEKLWLDEPDGPARKFITSVAAASMRRDPRYLQLAERTGLLAYWRSGRTPDFCRNPPEPICSQLTRAR